MFNGVCYWLFRQDMFPMCHRLPDLAQTRIRQCEQADHLYFRIFKHFLLIRNNT